MAIVSVLQAKNKKEIHYHLHPQLQTSHFSALQITELRSAICQTTLSGIAGEHCK